MALENDMDPSPVCPEAFKEVNWGSDVCALLRNLLLTNQKLGAFFEWMFKPPGDPPAAPVVPCNLSTQFAAQLIGLANPIGSGFWSAIDLDLDPKEWVEATGQSVLREGDYANLYKVFGVKFDPVGYSDATRFHLPDLKGRFLLNRGQRDPFVDNEGVTHSYPTYDILDPLGGDDQITLTSTNVPTVDHKHGYGVTPGWCDPPLAAPENTAKDVFYPTLPRPPQTRHKVKNHSVKLGVSMGNAYDIDDNSKFRDTEQTHFITTEPIPALRSNTPVEDEEVLPHNNMPPYVVGIYYIRANYVINGEIIKLKSA